jgi:hypothetical protein
VDASRLGEDFRRVGVGLNKLRLEPSNPRVVSSNGRMDTSGVCVNASNVGVDTSNVGVDARDFGVDARKPCAKCSEAISASMATNQTDRTRAALKILRALAEPLRLRAVQEIQQHGPTTTLPLGNRMGIDVKKMSWHLQHLRKAGLLEQGMGKVYKIPEQFILPNGGGLDFGPVVLRLGQDKR